MFRGIQRPCSDGINSERQSNKQTTNKTTPDNDMRHKGKKTN